MVKEIGRARHQEWVLASIWAQGKAKARHKKKKKIERQV